MRGKESLPGAEEAVALVCRLRWRCCGGGRWRCQAALWFQRQLQAVILSPTFFPVPWCSFVFSRSLAVSSFPSSQCWVFGVSLLCFGWFSLLFSLFGFFLSSGSLPLFLCFSFFSFLSFPPPSVSVFLGSIYRAKGVAFYCSHGEQPAGRPLGATAKVRLPPVFWQVRGRWAPGERGPGKIQTKAPFSFFPAACSGEEERGTVFRSPPPIVGRVFHFGPWSLIYAIWPSIDQQTFNFFNLTPDLTKSTLKNYNSTPEL
jgi:hypothetical protein